MKKMAGVAIFTLLTCIFLPCLAQDIENPEKEIASKPRMITLHGEIQEIRSSIGERKESPWGAAGTYIVIKTKEGKKADLHLGPSLIVDRMINGFAVHQHIIAEVFRPEDMAPGHYFVKTLQNGKERVLLRNNELIPVWKKRSLISPSS